MDKNNNIHINFKSPWLWIFVIACLVIIFGNIQSCSEVNSKMRDMFQVQ